MAPTPSPLSSLRRRLPAVAIVLSVGYAVILVLGGSSLYGAAWVVLGFLLVILMGIVAFTAGMAVVQALFVVAAELSLLIFLTQAYCVAPVRGPQNDAALASLFTVGILYIGFIFLKSLWDALTARYHKLADNPSAPRRVTSIVMFLLFTGIFIWDLYLVMGPIMAGLCVYK